ncbi:MAG: GMC family oxidoreductase [Actinobacteria bacterium]|nr:GMC family oxidoreductase [Actinomycetota bacterium]
MRTSFESLSAALLPPEAGGPEPSEVAQAISGFLAYQPTMVRAALKAGASGVEVFSVLTTGRRLGQLSVEQRERALQRIGSLPAASQGLAGLKAFTLLAAGAAIYSEEIARLANELPVARADPLMDVVAASAWPSTSRADVVVIGSGAGGAMAARSLARSGMSVIIIEEGRRFLVDEFRTRSALDRFGSLYRDGGSTLALGRVPVVLPIGRGVGGTTLVNSGTCYRTPEAVLRKWRDEAGLHIADPDRFGPFLDDVEATLQVAPVPLEVMGNNGRLALQGAAALNWRAGPLRRNAPGCAGRCQCAIGCPQNAKFGVHLNALPQACQAGARIVSEAKVAQILLEAGRACGVLAVRKDGSRLRIKADKVVVCAGATETPPLLRRSGLGGHPRTGRNLALHPALSAAGRFEKPVVAWHGVLQSSGIEELHLSDGILIEATSTPPGMGSMILPGYGRELIEELDASEHLATLGAMIADRPSGAVMGRHRPVLLYDLSRRDGARLLKALGAMARVLFAAGAVEVLTGIPGAMRLKDPEEIDSAMGAARVQDLHLAAFHPTGTVPAGADPLRFPVEPDGKLRGIQGVWVADASVLPSCPEVNPQMSIMAMSLAIAEGIASS